MLKLSGSLVNQPVMSLRSGGRIATAIEPVINPHNLKILGWWCKLPGGQLQVLLAGNVREIMPTGLAINDDAELSDPSDLVRDKEVLDLRFELIGKLVKTKRQKLGKVNDFSYNDGMFIQKLYVGRSLVKVFSSEDTLIIDRTQIIEITDSHILVRDIDIKVTDEELSGAFGAAAA